MIVPEKKSIQDYFSLINRILLRLNIFINRENNFKYLDSKTLSKTTDVYRSYKDEIFFKELLEKSGFSRVVSFQSNPFPTIRPLNNFCEMIITFFYLLIIKTSKNILRKNIFFNCSKILSRCHFLKGIYIK